MEQKIKEDLAICRILKTKELRYHIGMTAERASIDLIFSKENSNYHFHIDGVPLEEVENDAMLKIYNLK